MNTEMIVILLCVSNVITAVVMRQLTINECYAAYLRGMAAIEEILQLVDTKSEEDKSR
jgi:hypothetical protein